MRQTRTRTAFRYMVSTLVILTLLLTSGLAYADRAELDQIKLAIKAKGAKWVAEETSISKLSPEERKKRLGVDEAYGHDAEAAGPVIAPDAMAAAPIPSLDWRNVAGISYVTPIRNQGSCGSCWAFAVTAAMESQVLIDARLALDLSEQILVSCSGAGTCSGGSPSSASNYIRDVGLPLESCFIYTATNNSCSNACFNWQNNTYRLIGWHSVRSAVDDMKNAVYGYGPIVATFYVYSDFFSYRSGVYSYATGTYQGAHAVLVVGYDDVNQCFIVKNSWGTGWGEAGFFRIAYSEVTGTSRFGYSVLAYDGYSTTPCVQANPTLTLSPPSQPMVAGTSASFNVSVTNNDNSGCASSTFNLKASAPTGWTTSFGSSTLTISPGGSASTTLSFASPTSATGSNTITATATDSVAPTYTASASATANIQPPVCTRAHPKVAISPAVSNWNKAGSTVTYTVSVTNNDNSVCNASPFDLDATLPPGSWTAVLGSSSMMLNPGGSSTTTLSVTSPFPFADGTYMITVKGTNRAEPAYTASVTATEILISSLTVGLSTDKSNYKSNQPVSIKTTVSANGSLVPNAAVTFTVTNGGITVATGTATTDASGNASFTWAKKSKAAGTYSVKASATFNSFSGSNSATFKVQ